MFIPMSQTVRGVISRKKPSQSNWSRWSSPTRGPVKWSLIYRLRGLPYRPDLPRGWHQRQLPVPARPRSLRHRRGIGEGVTNVEAGDFVILNWRAVCGQCRACKRGRPHLVFDTLNATRR